MFKKILILLSLSTQTYSFSLFQTAEQAKKNMMEKAIIYSDYDLFAYIYNDPKFIVQNKTELKKMASKVFKDRLKVNHDKSFSKKDILRMGGGLVFLSYFFSTGGRAVNAYRALGSLQDKLGINSHDSNKIEQYGKTSNVELLVMSALGSICSTYFIYQGFKHKDNSEKLRNAAAIKQLLKTPQIIEVKINE
ncbi:hypothetical protein M1446_04950 [Candidatus Dependentiae bacterium]|nr:hypothetical protein [Candidatus Dependentiae bacterium]